MKQQKNPATEITEATEVAREGPTPNPAQDSSSVVSVSSVAKLFSWLLGWWQSGGAPAAPESGSVGMPPASAPPAKEAPPACLEAKAWQSEEPVQEPPVYLVLGGKPCDCQNPGCSGRTIVCRVFSDSQEAAEFARALAVDGCGVDVLRTPSLESPRRFAEPVLGYRPGLQGLKAIGVG